MSKGLRFLASEVLKLWGSVFWGSGVLFNTGRHKACPGMVLGRGPAPTGFWPSG